MGNGWNVGEKAQKGILVEQEFAVLVGLVQKGETEEQVNEYLDELAFLALTAGAKCLKRFTQKLIHPDSRTFIGKGKLEEIQTYIQHHEQVNMVIFDDDLTGKQVNILEAVLKVKIINRSTLFLDIFAFRAHTS